jgi:hypothetical protein
VDYGVVVQVYGGDDLLQFSAIEVAYTIVDGGSGNNGVLLDQGTASTSDVYVSSDGGRSTVILDDIVCGGNVVVFNDLGDSAFYLNGDIDGHVALYNPSGFHEVLFENAAVSGSVSIYNRSGGATTAFVDSGIAGDMWLANGNGDYETEFSNSEVWGSVTLRNGIGIDTLTIDSSTLTEQVKVINGIGNSVTTITNSEIGESDFTGQRYNFILKNSDG